MLQMLQDNKLNEKIVLFILLPVTGTISGALAAAGVATALLLWLVDVVSVFGAIVLICTQVVTLVITFVVDLTGGV